MSLLTAYHAWPRLPSSAARRLEPRRNARACPRNFKRRNVIVATSLPPVRSPWHSPLPRATCVARDEPGLPPAELTGFVGRKAELTGLTALLDTARLVTAVGPPGVGKTRVGLRAAALAAERYPDGVRFAELSELHDPALLAAAVAACLGLPERDGRSQRSAVLNYLRGRELLLILDTCEHLIDACAAFAEGVLREAPRVTLLATSRQPLDVPGEHVYPVRPLPVPEPSAAADGLPPEGHARRANGHHGDAAELFAQRAAMVDARIRRHGGQPRGRDTPVQAARRDPARDRTGRRATAGAAPARPGRPARVRARAAGRRPARHGAQAPDPARRGRVELRPVHSCRAGAMGQAFGVRGDVRHDGGRAGVRGSRPAGRRGGPSAHRPGRQVDSAARPWRRDPVPAAGHPARLRRRQARREQPGSGVPRPAGHPLPGHGQLLRRALPGRRPARAVPGAAPRARQHPCRARVLARARRTRRRRRARGQAELLLADLRVHPGRQALARQGGRPVPAAVRRTGLGARRPGPPRHVPGRHARRPGRHQGEHPARRPLRRGPRRSPRVHVPEPGTGVRRAARGGRGRGERGTAPDGGPELPRRPGQPGSRNWASSTSSPGSPAWPSSAASAG